MNINLDSAKDTLCKNIMIYGYCKFENKGCVFSHTRPAATPGTPKEKKRFNFNTPSFQPQVTAVTSKFQSLSPKLDAIPTFVPQGEADPAPKKFNVSASVFTPSAQIDDQINPYTPSSAGSVMNGAGTGEMYYPSATYPLNYHLYAPAPPPHLQIPLPPYATSAQGLFIDNEWRETLQKRNETTLQTLGQSQLPDSVGVFHSLVPLDMETESKVWHTPTALYKVFSNADGNAYALRKIDNYDIIKITTEAPFKTIKKWKSVNNANVVGLRECFTSIAFGGTSNLVLVYDYYPNSNTLLEQHFNRRLGSQLVNISEDLLWTYIIQITNALSAIHEKGLAARSTLDLSKIIVTGKDRIRLSSVGLDDILNCEDDDQSINSGTFAQHLKGLQAEDIHKFGVIMVELASSLVPGTSKTAELADKLRSVQTAFSDEFYQVVSRLTNDYHTFNLGKFNEVYLAKRTLKMVNNLQDSYDYAEAQLGSEIENGRLFRLMTKMNFVLDRPDKPWQENDKLHLLKLFHDYVFHQLDDNKKPVVDLSRVLTKLNKLDAGIDERFLLVTRDERVCILVSYKEIRDLIDSVFRELRT